MPWEIDSEYEIYLRTRAKKKKEEVVEEEENEQEAEICNWDKAMFIFNKSMY